MNAGLTRVEPGTSVLPLDELEIRVGQTYPGYRLVSAFLKPGTGDEGVGLFVDQSTGRILGTDDRLRAPMQSVHQLHTRLLAGRSGASILAWMSLALVILSVSGLVLWWPGKIFTFRRTDGGWRLLFNLHNALGAYAWIFLLLFGATGAVIHWDRQTRSVIDRLPEDMTPGGRTLVTLARCTGRVLETINSRTAPPGYRYTALWNGEIDTGDLYGWPSRIPACLFGLSLPLMAVTGPLMWFQRRRQRG